MKMRAFTNAILCSILAFAFAADCDAAGKAITLVEGGTATSTIVIGANPTPAADLASIEVQYFIEQMTGARLPIVNDQAEVTGNRILIGRSTFTDKLGLDASGYHQMESLIQFFPGTVVLLGRDDLKKDCRSFAKAPGHIVIEAASTIDFSKANGLTGKPQDVFIPGIFDYQGSLRATYRFLEDWCDIGMFGPNPVNVHIPKKATLKVSGGVHRHRSGIDTKSGATGINGRRSGRSQYGARPTMQQTALYLRRMRWGGEPWYVNHTFEHFNYKNRFIKPVEPTDEKAANYKKLRQQYEANRDAFEKVVDGLQPTGNSHQFCYTTKALITQIAEDARNFFDGKMGDNVDRTVHNLQGRSDTFFLVPFDVGGYCKCTTCKPLLDVGRGRAATDFNTGESSDYVFSFVNAVAREVATTHPDKFIGTLAYEGYYWEPKSFRLERNVTMSPCVHPKFWANCPETYAKNEFTHYKKWVKLAKDGKMGPMGMWNYDFDVPGSPTSYYAHERGEYVKMFLKDGVGHVFHCGAPAMLEMWVTNQLYETPGLDTDDLIDDFFDKYFGPAGKPMKKLQVLMEDYTTNPKYRPLALQGGYLHDRVLLYEHVLTDAQLITVRELINDAKALAPGAPYAERLAAWDKAMVGKYEMGMSEHYSEKAAAARKAAAAYTDVAPGYITGVTAAAAWHWYSGVKGAGLVDGVNMVEATPGQRGTREARLNPAKRSFRWNRLVRATGGWILFDLGAEYELDQMAVWNYSDQAGNTQHGMKDIEIAYARNAEDLFKQKWKKLPNQTLNRALKEGRAGADSVIDFKGKRVRYVYIHSLGAEGHGNWADPITPPTKTETGKTTPRRVDEATGMGGTAFDDRKFTIGLGQVRFYGKPLQLPMPELSIVEGKLELAVHGYDDATIHYTIDGSVPSKKSPRYTEGIAIDSGVVLRAKAFGAGLKDSDYVPTKVSIGDIVTGSAVAKSLSAEEAAGVRAAVLRVQLFDSDIGPYLKHLHVNGENMAEVPLSKGNWNSHFIDIPKEKLRSIKAVNTITFAGGRGDAYKLRNVTLYVLLADGSWVKSKTDGQVYSAQKKQHWVNSEGIVMNPIAVDLTF